MQRLREQHIGMEESLKLTKEREGEERFLLF
jgi:hypothetical protein